VRRTWWIARLALGGLRRTPLRVGLTALGVAIASGALVSMVAFALGLQRAAETPFEVLGLLNNIEISPKNDDPSDDSSDDPDDESSDNPPDNPSDDPPEKPAVLDDAALERIEALPGVAAAYADLRIAGVKLTRGDKTKNGMAIGLPPEAALFGSAADLLVAGHFFHAPDEPEVVLGERLVGDLGFESPDDAIGAKITLEAGGLVPGEAESFRFRQKELAVTIVGVYSLEEMFPPMGRRGVVLPIELMKDMPGARFTPNFRDLRSGKNFLREGYSSATVRVKQFSDLAPVEKAIRQMGFKTRTLLSQLEKMRAFFVFMDVLLAAVGTVALVVAGLGIVNTLLMSVLERYQEIGISKAIGASDGDVVVLFLTEAAVIGLIGGLAGLVLGWAVAWVLEIAINVYAQSQEVTAYLNVFAFPGWLLVSAVLFSVAVSVAAGVFPAIRAARIDPIRALRGE